MSLVAVINITSFNECPANAVKTVLQGKGGRFTEVHIINPAYIIGEQLYADWDKDEKELKDADIDVFIEDELNVDTIKRGDWVVEIPPMCTMSLSGIEQIQQRVNGSEKTETRFGLRTIVNLLGYFSLSYGYLLVMSFLANLWHGRYYDTDTDIKITAIIRKGNQKYLPFNDPQSKVMYPKNANVAVLSPGRALGGWRYLRWSIKHNENFNLWWWLYGKIPLPRLWVVFYLVLGGTTFYSGVEFIRMVLYFADMGPFNGVYTPWTVFSMTMVVFWGLAAIVALYASVKRYRFDFQVPMILMMPIYILTFWAVWIFGKIF